MEKTGRCYSGTVFLGNLFSDVFEVSQSLLPENTCYPDDGICFSAITQSHGTNVATFGCWPSVQYGDNSISWYGVPECKNEVSMIICVYI